MKPNQPAAPSPATTEAEGAWPRELTMADAVPAGYEPDNQYAFKAGWNACIGLITGKRELTQDLADLQPPVASPPAAQEQKPVTNYKTALDKIDCIRNSIIGMQGFNFSMHAYPLVAALKEAGYEGMSYEDARAYHLKLRETMKNPGDEIVASPTPASREGWVMVGKLREHISRLRSCVEQLKESPDTRVDATAWSYLEGALEEAEELLAAAPVAKGEK